jgi:hypothetical protein
MARLFDTGMPFLKPFILTARLVLVLIGLAVLRGPAFGQENEPTKLRLGGVNPYGGGGRITATESWGPFEFNLTNLTDRDRLARVMVFYEGQSDLQYGRDVWVPARSNLDAWMLVGPAPKQERKISRSINMLLYDRTDGTDRLVRPKSQEIVRDRLVPYMKRELTTTVLLDEAPPLETVYGQLPQPDSPANEALSMVRCLRPSRELTDVVPRFPDGPLATMPEAFAGLDQVVIASNRLKDDPPGLRALRQWLQRGGKVWVMLDRVSPDTIASLLGDGLDFQVIDKVGLTQFQIEAPAKGPGAGELPAQDHDRAVDFARVMLPPNEHVVHRIDGWPVWFTRSVGRGKVVFTALGPRGLYRPRGRLGPESPYFNYRNLPLTTPPLEMIADELERPYEDEPFRVEAFQQPLTEEIGYAVPSRRTVGLVFGFFALAALPLGLLLKRSRRPELVGWLGPVAALGAASALVGLGESSRRAVPPTMAVAQIVNADTGMSEAPVHGLFAMYRPSAGLATVGTTQGGFFDLDLAGVEGQTRRFMLGDLDAWTWENLTLPAGVRQATFQYTVPTGDPITAKARFGPKGLEGTLVGGPFQQLGDAIIYVGDGRKLAVRLQPGGAFNSQSQDALPEGQFLVSNTLLSDRQQRRQKLYNEFLKRTPADRPEGRPLLLAWADPIDMHFTQEQGARTVGNALLIIPLRLQRPGPGSRITIPGPMVTHRRVQGGHIIRLIREGRDASSIRLRFQLPPAVLPFEVERVRLIAKVDAPSRRVTVSGLADGKLVEVHGIESPLDPLRVEIDKKELLGLDKDGGLHLNLALSKPTKSSKTPNEKWLIQYLELEVVGRALPDR